MRPVLWCLVCLACLAAPPAAAASAPQNVSVRTEDGITILGSLYLPGRPGPGVILLHMQTKSREDWQAVASRLSDAGFAALAIDLRGHGASDPAPTGSDPLDLSRLTLDVKAARAFLASRPDVVQGRVGIAGASVGANLAILYAAADPSVRSLALLSAGLDFRGLRTEAAMGRLTKCSALLVVSDEDTYAANSARKLAQQPGGVRELRVLSGAGHGTVMLGRQSDLAGALVDWFRRTLL
jgi:dienelactone hydrolase